MQMWFYIITALAVAGLVYYVARPLFELPYLYFTRDTTDSAENPVQNSEQSGIIEAISDVELDFQSGKISEPEYEKVITGLKKSLADLKRGTHSNR